MPQAFINGSQLTLWHCRPSLRALKPRGAVVVTAGLKRGSAMAKRQRGTSRDAMKALGGAGVPSKEFGRFNSDGTLSIDQKALEGLKKKLGKAASRKVRFVALNAPFKRRSPTAPA
jgi:hypothetical protein